MDGIARARVTRSGYGRFLVLLPLVVLLGGGCGGKTREFGVVSDTALGGSVAYLDAMSGYRELPFGGGVTRDMKRAEKQDAQVTTSYVRSDEDGRVGAAKASAIRYVFFQNEFASVIIESSDRKNNEALLDALWKAFGSNVNRQAPFQVWNGKKNVAHFSREPSGKGRVTIWNREMIAKAVKENVARAAAARAAEN